MSLTLNLIPYATIVTTFKFGKQILQEKIDENIFQKCFVHFFKFSFGDI